MDQNIESPLQSAKVLPDWVSLASIEFSHQQTPDRQYPTLFQPVLVGDMIVVGDELVVGAAIRHQKTADQRATVLTGSLVTSSTQVCATQVCRPTRNCTFI